MSKNFSPKYCEENKERLQKKFWEIPNLSKEEKEKKQQYEYYKNLSEDETKLTEYRKKNVRKYKKKAFL